jgi:hypothetical protein
VDKTVVFKGKKKEERLKKKLKKLEKPNSSIPMTTPTLNSVTNFSGLPLSNDELTLLNKGLKYKPPTDPKNLKEQIIINIESKIKNMDQSEKLMIRSDCMKVLKKETTFQEKSQDENKTIKSHSTRKSGRFM